MAGKLEELNSKNSDLEIKSADCAAFRPYGKKVEGLDLKQLEDYMSSVEIPENEVVYYPSIAEMESSDVYSQLNKSFYAGQEAQIGYCAGNNSSLDALEYHKGCEIVYAITGVVLLLGHIWDIENDQYSSEKVEAFYVPEGTGVELYGTTLHYAPCQVEESGFKAVIILPKDTNTDFDVPAEKLTGEDKYIFANNKWLIAHPEVASLAEGGAVAGITGKNLEVNI